MSSIKNLSLGIVLLAASAAAAAEPPDLEYTLANILPRVPALTHDANGRLPLIAWPAFVTDANRNAAFQAFAKGVPLDAEMYRELVRRGFTQRIPMKDVFIPMAEALQQAGAAVIFVEGDAGPGSGGEANGTAHLLPKDFPLAKGDHVLSCPTILQGWNNRAAKVRATLAKFKEANVRVAAAWLDWEVEPWPGESQYAQAKACTRCRQILPPGVLDSLQSYAAFIYPLRAQLFSAYLAAPILEAYPDCSVTNWEAVFSSPQEITPSCWGNRHLPPGDVGLLTATNPVVYGNDIFYGYHWKSEWNYPLDGPHMDRVYTRIMLGQMSADAANRRLFGAVKQCVPWVCRWCPDANDPNVPIVSRERYREILRHVWLRGATGMQVFNEPRPPRRTLAIEELQDAVAVYDEMLAQREFLDHGVAMNLAVPEVTDDGPVWSGLRIGARALVRAFTQGPAPVPLKFKPFGAADVELIAPPAGATYLLTQDKDSVTVKKLGD